MTVTPLARLTASERHIVPCQEYGRINVDPREVLASDGRLMLAAGVLDRYVRADFKNSELRLTAKGVIGLIPLTERITIQVKPRFPIRNLTHMVSVCGYVPTVLSALRDYKVSEQWSEWLIDVMADGLLAAFDTITVNGLLRTYHQRTAVSSLPHGRINTIATMRHQTARGINHLAQHSWFERTVDNPPNRCLKSAVASLHTRYVYASRRKGVRERIARLGEAMRVLQDVTLQSRPFSLDDPQVRGVHPLPESRSYYRPALELAAAILSRRGISLDARSEDIWMPSLLVKTEDLFEEFLRISLREALSDNPSLVILDGNQDPGRLPLYQALSVEVTNALPEHKVPFPTGEGPKVEPDIVFLLDDGSHPLVADVKYTNVKDFADRSEVEQVLLYGVRYKSPIAMTIHPCRAGAKKGLHVAGRVGDIVVVHYLVDLGAVDMEAEMDELAACVSELIASRASLTSAVVAELPSPA